jgi:hypothetical protein
LYGLDSLMMSSSKSSFTTSEPYVSAGGKRPTLYIAGPYLFHSLAHICLGYHICCLVHLLCKLKKRNSVFCTRLPHVLGRLSIDSKRLLMPSHLVQNVLSLGLQERWLPLPWRK